MNSNMQGNNQTRQEIKNKVLGDIYFGIILLILPLGAISWFRFANMGRIDLFYLTLSFPFILAFIHIFRRQFGYIYRTYIMIGTLYIAGISAYFQLGIISIGLALLFASSFVAVMLLSRKISIFVMTINGLTLLLLSVLIMSRRITFDFRMDEFIYSIETWMIQMLGYAMLTIVVTLAIRRVNTYNENFIDELQEKNEEIQDKLDLINEQDQALQDKDHALNTTQQIAENSEALYQTLFNSLDELVYAMDLDGRFEVVNDNLLKTLHTSEDAVLGKTIYEIFPGSDSDAQWESTKQRVIFTGEKDIQYNTFKDPTGKIHTYEVTLLPIYINGEVGKLMGTSRNITELLAQEETIQRLAYTDHLTGIKNRMAFKEFIESHIKNYTIGTYPFVICMIDVDDFKAVNDAVGHLKGDELIVAVADRLKISFEDLLMVARIGGDEFAVAATINDSLKDTEELIKRIHDTFAKPFTMEDQSFTITVSTGTAIYPYDGKDYEELFSGADFALFNAKKKGHDQHEGYKAKPPRV